MRIAELCEQQDGAFCVINTANTVAFLLFFVVWGIVSLKNGELAEIPTNLSVFLGALFGTKVIKDKVDYDNGNKHNLEPSLDSSE